MKHTFSTSNSLIVVSSVGAVNLQTHGTSLCPGDIVAVFVCEANGTSVSWRICDNYGTDAELEHNSHDTEGGYARRNAYSATLLRKFAVDQHCSFTSNANHFWFFWKGVKN